MRKPAKIILLLAGCAILLPSLYLYRTLESGRGDARAAFLENLNASGEFQGPECLQFDPAGNLYVGDAHGIVWILPGAGTPREFFQFVPYLKSQGWSSDSSSVRMPGLAIAQDGSLYVSVPAFSGGSILKIDAKSGQAGILSQNLGSPGPMILSGDGSRLWVADTGRQGRLLGLKVDSAPPVVPDREIAPFEHPEGLVFGQDENTLYVAESISGSVAKVDLTSSQPQVVRIARLVGDFSRGSLRGMAFDPRDQERRFLYVAENLRGLITVLDLKSNPPHPAKRISLATMGGRPCPASLTIRDGYLYFTDLWSCSPARLLMGIPQYRQHAYRFRITDLTSIYGTMK